MVQATPLRVQATSPKGAGRLPQQMVVGGVACQVHRDARVHLPGNEHERPHVVLERLGR